jgi:hypothetical protein
VTHVGSRVTRAAILNGPSWCRDINYPVSIAYADGKVQTNQYPFGKPLLLSQDSDVEKKKVEEHGGWQLVLNAHQHTRYLPE